MAKIAGAGAGSGSRRRQREGVGAGYWHRYCAKNDTVGFFGPLAWGGFRDHGPAVDVGSGALVASREVHFESWCLEALGRAVGAEAVVPLNRRPEIEWREQLETLDDIRALAALDRLERGGRWWPRRRAPPSCWVPSMPSTHVGYRSVPMERLLVRGHEAVDRTGGFRAPPE